MSCAASDRDGASSPSTVGSVRGSRRSPTSWRIGSVAATSGSCARQPIRFIAREESGWPGASPRRTGSASTLEVIIGDLLEPFARGRSRVRIAAFDEPTDSPVDESVVVDPDAILVFDGLFLHRPELNAYWTTTIFLEADQRCDQAWLDYLLGDLPANVEQQAAELDARLRRARWPRYRQGWATYIEAVRPADRANLIIDNNDLDKPRLLASR